MVQTRSKWLVGGASVIGASHIRRGTVNQDAITWSPRSGAERTFVAAVSDGHGGDAYVRSDLGAMFAVEAAMTAFQWATGDTSQLQHLPDEVVEIWRKSVLDHAGAHPLEGAPVDNVLVAYGATLIAVGLTDKNLVALQIGDGDLLFGYPDGSIQRPLADDEGLVGEQTYSLCLDHAASYMRTCVVDGNTGRGWPDFVLLSTDGVSKSFVDNHAYMAIADHYRKLCLQGAEAFQATLDALPDWLKEISEKGSGDDVSLCLAARLGDEQ